MIPFVVLELGPISAYGLMCAIALFAWDPALTKQAERRGFDRKDFGALTVLMIVSGWFFAWWIDAVFCRVPGASGAGFSSTGAIVGAVAAGLFWARVKIEKLEGRWRAVRREKPLPVLPIAEVVVSTWPIAFAFGRLGCALVHDHPGPTVAKGTLASFVAVAWPRGPEDGVHHALGPLHVVTGGSDARLDLGLIEFVILAIMAVGFARTWKRDVPMGTYTIVGGLVYGPIRFGLDFLRLREGGGGEARFLGLTFAQYFCLAIFGLALALLARRRVADVSASGAAPRCAPARSSLRRG